MDKSWRKVGGQQSAQWETAASKKINGQKTEKCTSRSGIWAMQSRPPELWHQLVITTKKQPELETAKTFLIRGFAYYTFYTFFVLVIQALT